MHISNALFRHGIHSQARLRIALPTDTSHNTTLLKVEGGAEIRGRLDAVGEVTIGRREFDAAMGGTPLIAASRDRLLVRSAATFDGALTAAKSSTVRFESGFTATDSAVFGVGSQGSHTREVQTVTTAAGADDLGGTFTLGLGGQTTSALAKDVSNTDVQTALNALSMISGASVARGAKTAGNGYVFTVTFAAGAGDLPLLACDKASLTGTSATCSAAEATKGVTRATVGFDAPVDVRSTLTTTGDVVLKPGAAAASLKVESKAAFSDDVTLAKHSSLNTLEVAGALHAKGTAAFGKAVTLGAAAPLTVNAQVSATAGAVLSGDVVKVAARNLTVTSTNISLGDDASDQMLINAETRAKSLFRFDHNTIIGRLATTVKLSGGESCLTREDRLTLCGQLSAATHHTPPQQRSSD